jgi:hypothetical protein
MESMVAGQYPRITGSWTGTETFTEGKHRITVDAVLSKAMHEELKHVGVQLLGEPQPNGSMEPGIDVYFVDRDSRMAASAFRISENTPSKLMVRVPSSLMKGEYTLRIVTHYTSGSILLKEPRTIEYEHPLVVK